MHVKTHQPHNRHLELALAITDRVGLGALSPGAAACLLRCALQDVRGQALRVVDPAALAAAKQGGTVAMHQQMMDGASQHSAGGEGGKAGIGAGDDDVEGKEGGEEEVWYEAEGAGDGGEVQAEGAGDGGDGPPATTEGNGDEQQQQPPTDSLSGTVPVKPLNSR